MVRKLLTPAWAAFSLLMLAAVGVCALLCRWQWERYSSADGSLQNLAYTVQWPIFAAFAVYVWWRVLRDAVLDARGRSRPVVAEPAEGSEGSTSGGPAGGGPAQREAARGRPADGTPARKGGVEAAAAAAGLGPHELAGLPLAARRRLGDPRAAGDADRS